MSQGKFGRSYQPLPNHQAPPPNQDQAGRRNDEKQIDQKHMRKHGKPARKGLGKANPGKMMRMPNAAGGGGGPMQSGGWKQPYAGDGDEY